MNYTNRLGEITELKCRLDFAKRGISLSQPTNPSCRYDFISDIGGKLIRIQCKTCHLERYNIIAFTPSSKNWNTGEIHNYIDDIDYFYTNWNNQGYLIRVESCKNNLRSKSIRLGEISEYHSNNTNAVYSNDVQIDKVLHEIAPEYYYEIIDIESNAKKAFEKRYKEYYCTNCGCRTSTKHGMCWRCSKKDRAYTDKPTRDELKELIRTISFTHIASKYQKTDNAIRKWCAEYGLPTKKSVINFIADDVWENI